jgi:hypothetical protein
MSKKHYEAIASGINAVMWSPLADPATVTQMIVVIARICEEDNPRFDYTRFVQACTNKPSTK